MDFRDYAARTRADFDSDAYVDAMLDRMGLQRKSEGSSMMLSALGIFGAGLAVGASLGMLFAPKPGPEIRREVTSRFTSNDSASNDVRANGASSKRASTPSAASSERSSEAVTGG